MKRPLKRGLFALSGTAAGFFALVGVAHTDLGRPLLGLLRGVPGCPVLHGPADPARAESFRVSQLSRRTGIEPAKSRQALGFELGKTARPAVATWADSVGASCQHSGTSLRCFGFRETSGAPRLDDVLFQFDPAGALVAVDVLRAPSDARQALAYLEELASKLERDVGPATSEVGEQSTSYLEGQRLRRRALEFGYRDYVARASATSFGARGVRIREQYQFMPGA